MKIKLLAVAVFSALLFTAPLALAYDPLSGACQNGDTSSSAVCSDQASNTGVNPIYHSINIAADIIAVIAGIAGVIVIMVAGLNYVTSGGDSAKVAAAKSKIIGAVIGLVIVALAWTITSFGIKLIK